MRRRYWDALAARAHDFEGTFAIISAEQLGPVRRGGDGSDRGIVRDARVHVVYTARDLSRVIPAMWHTRTRNGHHDTWDAYVRGLRDAPDSDAWPWDMSGQNPARVLARWARHVPEERIHLVTVPAAGSAAGAAVAALRRRARAARRGLHARVGVRQPLPGRCRGRAAATPQRGHPRSAHHRDLQPVGPPGGDPRRARPTQRPAALRPGAGGPRVGPCAQPRGGGGAGVGRLPRGRRPRRPRAARLRPARSAAHDRADRAGARRGGGRAGLARRLPARADRGVRTTPGRAGGPAG